MTNCIPKVGLTNRGGAVFLCENGTEKWGGSSTDSENWKNIENQSEKSMVKEILQS
jgi:hypothetical protein